MLILAKSILALTLGFVIAIVVGILIIPVLKRGNSNNRWFNIYNSSNSCCFIIVLKGKY